MRRNVIFAAQRCSVYPPEVSALRTINNILVSDYIPMRRCTKSLLTESSRQLCFKFSRVVRDIVGIRNLTTSAYYFKTNGGTERVNDLITPMLLPIVKERQNESDTPFRHVESP